MSGGNNKQIAKNTLLLYFRMLLIMGVSLYTVKVLLRTLGIIDYGIYSVVGGVVVMFSFISNTMASATQRFFAFEIGRKDFDKLKRIFSQTVLIYVLISFITLIFAETLGLWFLNHKMVIPAERVDAANWVYQLSILSFIVTIMSIPYNAAIIAHENMKIYAYVSSIEAFLKLAIVYFLVYVDFDKLKLYSVLMLGSTLLVTFIYRTICKRKYKECIFKFEWDTKLFQSLLSYSGWNMVGAIANVLNNYGINILLNLFFGPAINAARGISFQVSTVINQFVMNFHTAVKPQITKLYANDEKYIMLQLVYRSSKYSFFLLSILSFPLLLETDYILHFWLNVIPDYTVIFVQLALIVVLIDSISYSLQAAAQSTGKIKYYQLLVGGLSAMNLPISFLFLRAGFQPEITFYISIIIAIACVFLRLKILNRLVGLKIKIFFGMTLKPIILVSLFAFIIPLCLIYLLEDNKLRFLIVSISSVSSTLICIYILGLNSLEKSFFLTEIKNRIFIGLKKHL